MFKSLSRIVPIIFFTCLSFNVSATNLDAQIADYKKITESIIQSVVSGDVDVPTMIADNKKLIAIGVELSKAYQEKYPQSQKMMQAIIDNADSMQTLSLESIEEQWHDNGIFTEGKYKTDFDIDDEDVEDFHNPKGAVVHPATAIIAIQMWEKDKNEEHLTLIKEELQEVLHHLQLMKDSLQ
ncbi:hypothetical protein MT390_16400 [Vibrio sp. 2-Bac 85]